MAKLSDKNIAQFAAGGGFSGGGLVMAVAIALAESGGDPKVSGYNKVGNRVTSIDRGLWQINNVYHAEVSDGCAYDPACSAKAAYKISAGGSNWQPWATYTHGLYRGYVARAQAAVKAAGGSTSGGTSGPAPTPGSTGTSQQHGDTTTLAELLGAPTPATVEVQLLGDQTKDVMAPYRVILALTVMFGFLYVISKSRLGYAAIYYGQVLILLFLFATQAQFFKEALRPLAPQQAEVPSGPGTVN